MALRVLALGVCLLTLASEAWGAGWVRQEQVAFRLLAMHDTVPANAPVLVSALEVALEPQWKLYWRSAGYGLAPRFDFSQAVNVRRAVPRWPVPSRHLGFVLAGSTPPPTILAYAGHVLFPIEVQLERPGASTILRLHFDYAVCYDACIRDEVDLELLLPAGTGGRNSDADRIEAGLARLPVEPTKGGVRVMSATLNQAEQTILIGVEALKPLTQPDVFLETTQGGYFLASHTALASGGRRAIFRLVVPADQTHQVSANRPVRLTILGGPRPVETAVLLSPQ